LYVCNWFWFFWITYGLGSWKNLSLPGVFNGPKTWTKPPPGVENCNDGLLGSRPNCDGEIFCDKSPFITCVTPLFDAVLPYCGTVGVANGADFWASWSISWRCNDG